VDAPKAKRAGTNTELFRIVGAQAGIVLPCRTFLTSDAVSEDPSRTICSALDEVLGRSRA